MKDTVVEEIRRRRRGILRDTYGGSIDKLVNHALDWQAQQKDKVVSLRSRIRKSAAA